MNSVQEIEQKITKLSSVELAEFRQWFLQFDSDAWDEQIEKDATAGKIDAIAKEATAEYEAGKAEEI